MYILIYVYIYVVSNSVLSIHKPKYVLCIEYKRQYYYCYVKIFIESKSKLINLL